MYIIFKYNLANNINKFIFDNIIDNYTYLKKVFN